MMQEMNARRDSRSAFALYYCVYVHFILIFKISFLCH